MDCVFCKIIAKEIPSETVFENEELIAFKDIKPSASVHILIVPKRHIASVKELAAADAQLVGDMVLAARDIAEQQALAGYKLAVNVGRDGGQIVDHLHLHLLSPDVAGGHV